MDSFRRPVYAPHMSTETTTSSRRLESLRRARARALIQSTDAQSARKSRWGFDLTHPVFIAILAAAIGLASGLITSSVASSQQLSQYWRDKRLQVYGDYYRELEATELTEISIAGACDDLEKDGFNPTDAYYDYDHYLQIHKQMSDVTVRLETAVRPVPLIADQEIRIEATTLYTAHLKVDTAYTILVTHRGEDDFAPSYIENVRSELREVDSLSSLKFVTLSRRELGVR